MLVKWKLLHPNMTEERLGFIPYWLNTHDQRSAKEQLHHHYMHGGGWFPFEGFCLGRDNSLRYFTDPPLRPLAEATLRDEKIVFYDHSWVAIIQPDRTFEVARID